MYIFLSIAIAIVSLLLIFIVMIQESKGGGLAAGFSSANNVVGVRRASSGVERITWILAGILGVLCIAITHWSPNQNATSSSESVIIDQVNKATIPAAPDAMPFGGNNTTAEPTPTEPATPSETEAPAEAQ